MPDTLKAINISFGYGPEKKVLQEVSLNLHPGELIHITGENGAGKTTLLKILCGLLEPNTGEILYQGKNISAHGANLYRSLAWLPATEGSFPQHWLGKTFVEFWAQLHNNAQFKQSISPLFNLDSFQEAWGTPYARCSSGMRQLLQWARVLAGQPKLLILDEPIRSLDAKAKEVIKDLLLEQKNCSIIYSSHDLDLGLPQEKKVRLHAGRLS